MHISESLCLAWEGKNVLFSLLLNFIMASGILLVLSKESELQAEIKAEEVSAQGQMFQKV